MLVSQDEFNKFLVDDNLFTYGDTYYYLKLDKYFVMCKMVNLQKTQMFYIYYIKGGSEFESFCDDSYIDYLKLFSNNILFEDFKLNIKKVIREIRLNNILKYE